MNLDDISMVRKKILHHTLKTLLSVLKTLQGTGRNVRLIKCEFLKSMLHFLGQIIDGHGIHTTNDKAAVVTKLPRPKVCRN